MLVSIWNCSKGGESAKKRPWGFPGIDTAPSFHFRGMPGEGALAETWGGSIGRTTPYNADSLQSIRLKLQGFAVSAKR